MINHNSGTHAVSHHVIGTWKMLRDHPKEVGESDRVGFEVPHRNVAALRQAMTWMIVDSDMIAFFDQPVDEVRGCTGVIEVAMYHNHRSLSRIEPRRAMKLPRKEEIAGGERPKFRFPNHLNPVVLKVLSLISRQRRRGRGFERFQIALCLRYRRAYQRVRVLIHASARDLKTRKEDQAQREASSSAYASRISRSKAQLHTLSLVFLSRIRMGSG